MLPALATAERDEQIQLRRRAAADIPPDTTPRVPTGEPELDKILRGGFARTSTVLIFGDAGHGKTRAALRIVTSLGRSLVMSLEMPEDLTVETARSAGAELGGMFVIEDRRGWEREAEGVDAILVDSVSVVTHPVRFLRELRDWATHTGGIVIAIGQVNARGKILGPNALKHWPDYVITCPPPVVPGFARLSIGKSRYCPPGVVDVPIVPPP